jgi:epoxyqueuosine reductase
VETGAALKRELAARARSLGFAALGVTRPDSVPEAGARLRAFVGAGRHGTMRWMAERLDWRGDPTRLWPAARSVVMLADSYAPKVNPLTLLADRGRAVISCYAWGRDYHDVVKGRLKTLAQWLAARAGAEVKVFVDTAPLMEKPLAQAAGLGWQGKHTNLLGRDLGNWVFLGAIFTTLELEPDAPETGHCGSCTSCLDICPTRAFPAPYQLDARRCISYLTIEHRGPVEPELRALMGNRIYGCDDCLAVCPWNKFAVAARDIGYAQRVGLPELAELAALDDAGFRARFAGSPIKRIGRDRMVRNVMYAVGNSGLRALAPVARARLDDADPAVAEAAAWALGRLSQLQDDGIGPAGESC